MKDNKDLVTSRGFAFCEYTNETGVSLAIKYLNGLKLCGRQINVRRTQNGCGLGSHLLVQPQQMSEQERRVFDARIGGFIESVH